MGVAFIDLKKQYGRIGGEIQRAIEGVLSHGAFIMGPEVAELERRLAEFAGTAAAVSCSSGTDALLLSLMAMGVGPGDAVVTTPFTFFATAEAIAVAGAVPVFADVDPETFNLDPDAVEEALDRIPPGLTARGIIAVDIFGLPCDYGRLNALARKRGLFVIEDGAQSFGATYEGRGACSLAAAGCASFFPAKPLGCYGDGGAVLTDDPALAETLASLRVHGKGKDKYHNARIGLNARLDTLQAAILLAKLAVFPDELVRRREIAARYGGLFAASGGGLVPQRVPEDRQSAWAQYSLLAPNPEVRGRILAGLSASGVPARIYYPVPLHLQPAFSGLDYAPGDFPASEDLCSRIFSLPMHPYLEDHEVGRVVEATLEAAGGRQHDGPYE